MKEGGKNDAVLVTRKSRETEIEVKLSLVPGPSAIHTGIGFLDHLIGSLSHHAGWSLNLRCSGDLEVDDHHSAEDSAIVLGIAFKEVMSGLDNPRRFGSAYAPLDEALARAVVDLSGRPWCEVSLDLQRASIGALASENIGHFLATFAMNAGITLHIDLLKGANDHHRAEAAFKALALALKSACQSVDIVPNLDSASQDEAVAGSGATCLRQGPGNSTKGRASISVRKIDSSSLGGGA